MGVGSGWEYRAAEGCHDVGERGGRGVGFAAVRRQRHVHVGGTGRDQFGYGFHAAGDVGPVVVAAGDAHRRLHLQPVGIATRVDPGVTRALRARRDPLHGLAHDRDPRVAVAHEPVEVAGVQRARDPQRHTVGLTRLRVAVGVRERE